MNFTQWSFYLFDDISISQGALNKIFLYHDIWGWGVSQKILNQVAILL